MTKRLMRLLHNRRMTAGKLAAAIGSGRAHVSQVLSNVPGRGGHTRRKLVPLMTEGELAELGWGDGAKSEELRVKNWGKGTADRMYGNYP